MTAAARHHQAVLDPVSHQPLTVVSRSASFPMAQRLHQRLEAELVNDRYAAATARSAAMSYDEVLDPTTRARNALLQHNMSRRLRCRWRA
jgi:O-methyltransferase involved in polyketide biosynthesis